MSENKAAYLSSKDKAFLATFAEKSAFAILRQATRALTRSYNKRLKKAGGLRATQMSVLQGVAIHGPISALELSKILVMDPSTLSRGIKALEKDELVCRMPVKNKHPYISITTKGVALMRDLTPVFIALMRNTDAMLGGIEMEKSLEKLRIMTEALQRDER